MSTHTQRLIVGPRALALALLAAVVAVAVLAVPGRALAPGNRIPWAGGSWYLNGVNYPWVNYGNDFGSNAWGSYGVHATATYNTVDADFAQMRSEGISSARWFVFADGRAGITFDSSGNPAGLDAAVFPDLDAALALAAKHGIYLDLVLLDEAWMANATYNSGVQMGGHASVINTAAGQQALVNNVLVPVLQRYGSNSNVIAWEVMNEPEWAISDLRAVNSNVSQPSTLANFRAFTSAAVSAIHRYTSAYATVGSADVQWASAWTGLGLDFYQFHFYDWMHPWANQDLYDMNAASLNLDAPVVAGEYSAASSTTATLSQYLDNWFNRGYAGAWAWSFRGVDSQGAPAATTMTSWDSAHASAVTITVTATSPTPTPTAAATPTPAPTATPAPSPTAVPNVCSRKHCR